MRAFSDVSSFSQDNNDPDQDATDMIPSIDH